MSDDQADPRLDKDKVRSHAITLKVQGSRIVEDFDEGRLAEAEAKARRVEELAGELSDLIADLREGRA